MRTVPEIPILRGIGKGIGPLSHTDGADGDAGNGQHTRGRAAADVAHGLDRGLTQLWIDGTAKDFAALREFQRCNGLQVYRLPRRHVPVLAGCRLPRLTALSVRHADTGDLQFLAGFATLENLMVWQCPKLTRFDGLERLTRLRALALNDLGAIESLAPLAALTQLEALGLTGGVWTTQGLPSLQPLRALTKLERLNLVAAKVIDGDLGPLCDLKHLSQLELSPRNFEPAELARVAAAHPFWRRWLLDLATSTSGPARPDVRNAAPAARCCSCAARSCCGARAARARSWRRWWRTSSGWWRRSGGSGRRGGARFMTNQTGPSEPLVSTTAGAERNTAIGIAFVLTSGPGAPQASHESYRSISGSLFWRSAFGALSIVALAHHRAKTFCLRLAARLPARRDRR